MTTLDGRGAPIKAGDTVIWHDNRANSMSGAYRVKAVKKRVQIIIYSDYITWVDADNVIVVNSLPYVQGGLNTEERKKND